MRENVTILQSLSMAFQMPQMYQYADISTTRKHLIITQITGTHWQTIPLLRN